MSTAYWVTRLLLLLLTLQACADPHVVRFKNLFLTNSHLAVVLEYVEGGDLFQYCAENGPLPEEQARRFFQQLVIGLDYCHAMGVVNR